MVRFNIADVTENMVLGESIILPTGELLLGAGYPIKRRYIERLKKLGYANIMVQVEGTEEVMPTSTVSESTQREMLKSFGASAGEIRGTFDRVRQQGMAEVKKTIRKNKKHLSRFILNAGITRAIEQFIEEIMNQDAVILNLSTMQKSNMELFSHSINVTITSLCIGRKYRMTYEELKQLAVGALNYDMGLVTMPRELLDNDQVLSPDELAMLRQHTINGYLILSECPTIPSTSAAAALQHHEFQDGSGYPGGLKGDNLPPVKDFSRKHMIHRFAEIIAVADKYDMMSSGRRYYSRKYEIREVMKRLIQMSGTMLNSEIVKTLISVVPIFPVGVRVTLTDAPARQLIGFRGVVAKDNPAELERPQVILYETKSGQRLPKPILVDTAQHPGFVLELVSSDS